MNDRQLMQVYRRLEEVRRLLLSNQTGPIGIMRLAEVVCTLIYTYDCKGLFTWEEEREVMWTLSELLGRSKKEALEAHEKLEEALGQLGKLIKMEKLEACA